MQYDESKIEEAVLALLSAHSQQEAALKAIRLRGDECAARQGVHHRAARTTRVGVLDANGHGGRKTLGGNDVRAARPLWECSARDWRLNSRRHRRGHRSPTDFLSAA